MWEPGQTGKAILVQDIAACHDAVYVSAERTVDHQAQKEPGLDLAEQAGGSL